VRAGQPVRWRDVACDTNREAVRVRRDLETLFRAEFGLEPMETISAERTG
jgi:hypothetical protein